MRKKKRTEEKQEKKALDPENEKGIQPIAEDADGIAEYTANLAKCIEILMSKK